MPRLSRPERRQRLAQRRARIATTSLRLLGHFPLGVNRRLGAALGHLGWWFGTEAKTISLDNIRRCLPQLTDPEQQALAKASVIHTAITAAEVGTIWASDYQSFKDHIVEIENEALLKKKAASERGLILLAPHLGNWEVFGLLMPRITAITFMYQPTDMEALDDLMRESRSKEGVKLAPTNRFGVSQVLKALKNGEAVGILPDQVPDTAGGEIAPFFDQNALTMTLVHKLIQRTGCDVVMGFAQRVEKGFRVVFLEADPNIHSGDSQISLSALNKSVETCVRMAPEQYQWEYKRFKRADKVKASGELP